MGKVKELKVITEGASIGSAINARLRDIDDMLHYRAKMSPEAKAEPEWKEKDKKYKAEISLLKRFQAEYDRLTDN